HGDRALLAYGPGMDSVRAFWACLYGGIIPVPAPSPEATRLKSALPRLRAIAEDARASAVLTSSALCDAAAALTLTSESGLTNWIATDVALDEWGEFNAVLPASGDDVAYLQYTSGSTSSPRGVQVTHANVLDNCNSLLKSNGADGSSKALFWLPYF